MPWPPNKHKDGVLGRLGKTSFARQQAVNFFEAICRSDWLVFDILAAALLVISVRTLDGDQKDRSVGNMVEVVETIVRRLVSREQRVILGTLKIMSIIEKIIMRSRQKLILRDRQELGAFKSIKRKRQASRRPAESRRGVGRGLS